MRHVLIALTAGTTMILATPLAAQAAPQAPATPPASAAQPVSSTPPAAANSAAQQLASQASNSVAANQSAAAPAPKPKICEATVIRAGPNQGQVINKCHH
jgi:hypothetical protein